MPKSVQHKSLLRAHMERVEERYQHVLAQSHEAIYCTAFDEPVDVRLPVEEQIDTIYMNAYLGECNQLMAEMYGYASPSEFEGKRLVDVHGGSTNPVNRDAFRAFINNGYRTVDAETFEVTPDGRRLIFLSNNLGVVKGGKLLRIWGTAVDITERRKLEAEREFLGLQLEQAKKREALGQMAAGVAHDFSNVLAGIHGGIRLLQNTLEPQERTRVLGELEQIIKYGTDLTRALIEYASVGSLHRTRVALGAALATAITTLNHLYPQVQVVTAAVPRESWVSANQSVLERGFLNVLINGAHAMALQGTLTVDVSTESLAEAAHDPLGLRTGEYVRVDFTDTGAGMDAETCRRAFEPFFTTKSGEKGSGLGLAMLKALVEECGGAVSMRSALGRGTTLTVRLPASPAA